MSVMLTITMICVVRRAPSRSNCALASSAWRRVLGQAAACSQPPPRNKACTTTTQTSKQHKLDTLGIEPRAFRMRSGCDTTTPCAHSAVLSVHCDLRPRHSHCDRARGTPNCVARGQRHGHTNHAKRMKNYVVKSHAPRNSHQVPP